MRIVLNEIKKIFESKMIVLIMLVIYVLYNMFISFYIDTFPNGRPQLDYYNLCVEMTNKYGQDIDEEELVDLKGMLEDKLKQAEEFLSSTEFFAKYGVNTYDEYKNTLIDASEEGADRSFSKGVWTYLEADEGTILWELQELPDMIKQYENRANYNYLELEEEKHHERIKEIISKDENKSILPYEAVENYLEVIKRIGMCIVSAVVFILAPMFVRDKKSKVEQLQCSSKKGRKVYKTKLLAGIISALLITTIGIVAMFSLYGPSKISMFFNANINSVYNGRYWFSMTFLQYIIVTIAFVYIISSSMALITMFISSKARTYIGAIGMQVPILIGVIILMENIIFNYLFLIYRPRYLALIIVLGLMFIAIMLTILSCKKEKTKQYF